MNKRLLAVLMFALVVSAGASYLVYHLISSELASNAKSKGTSIVVASHNLQTGDLIKDGDVKLADYSGPLPQGVFTKTDDVIGRGVIEPVYENEAVLQSRVAAKGAGAGLAATIPPGMRAVAIRVNDVVGVAGFVTPGMHVDLLISGNPPNNKAPQLGTQTKTLLQDIYVLSAGQNIQKDSEGKPIAVNVVNLLVTPEQAEILSLASSETRIQLVLRNPTDKKIAKTTGTAVAYLFQGGAPTPPASEKAPVTSASGRSSTRRRRAVAKRAPEPVAPPKPPDKIVVPITVEVYQGSRKTETKFKEEVKNPALTASEASKQQ